VVGAKRDTVTIEAFLRNRIRSAIALDVFGSVAAFVGGLLALVITFWLAYGALYFGFQWLLPHTHQTRLLISGAFLILLFIGNARTSRDYLTAYEISTVDGREPYTIYLPEVGMTSNLNFLDPKTVNSMTKIIAQLLFIGPRLFVAATRLIRRVGKLREVRVLPCARGIEMLRRHRGRVPFTEILAGLDDDAAVTLQQLLLLDALQFLQSAPPGAMLTSKFREELDRVVTV
jgi:hypothetical protein